MGRKMEFGQQKQTLGYGIDNSCAVNFYGDIKIRVDLLWFSARFLYLLSGAVFQFIYLQVNTSRQHAVRLCTREGMPELCKKSTMCPWNIHGQGLKSG